MHPGGPPASSSALASCESNCTLVSMLSTLSLSYAALGKIRYAVSEPGSGVFCLQPLNNPIYREAIGNAWAIVSSCNTTIKQTNALTTVTQRLPYKLEDDNTYRR